MRFFALAITLWLFPFAAYGATLKIYTATQTGWNGDALSGSPVTNVIDMQEQFASTEVTFYLTFTAGTTTAATATCEESANGTTWTWKMNCPAGVCVKWQRDYDLTTVTASTMNVTTNAAWLRCTLTGTGTGTISAEATRGRP